MSPHFLCAAIVALLAVAITSPVHADANPDLRPVGSKDVLYKFPTAADGLSVTRGGELALSLHIPGFPAWLVPHLSANYSSRGGDGVMGIGWDVDYPVIQLDLQAGRHVLDTSPADHVETVGTATLLRRRWLSPQDGPLVCEPNGSGSTNWHAMHCFARPRGVRRFTPNPGGTSPDFASSFESIDPHEGVTRVFGGTVAATILDDSGRPVAWLLAEERNRHTGIVKYFYEERTGSDERLRVAVLMGGDKVVRFKYEPRSVRVTSSYTLGTRRSNEHLLSEVELLDNCIPVQRGSGTNVWTDFSPCSASTILEKIELTYRDPMDTFTGRYALAAWQHLSGDSLVAYPPVTFEYTGDGLPAHGDGTTSSNVVTPELPEFVIPDGFNTASSQSHAPFGNYIDFNRDGLADWVETKEDPTDFSIKRQTTGASVPRIYVHPRNDSEDFDSRHSYEDPLASGAAWMVDYVFADLVVHTSSGPFTYFPPHDVGLYTSHTDNFDRTLSTGGTHADIPTLMAAPGMPGIGIDITPLQMDVADPNNLDHPLIRYLSASVPCRRLDRLVDLGRCDAVIDAYLCAFQGDCGEPNPSLEPYNELSVKLADLVDMDGDGYLDRVVSGLLVIWDPNDSSSDTHGFRDPTTADPAVYVARFNAIDDAFEPFRRYAIGVPTGDFSDLNPSFLSALAITHSYNQPQGGGSDSNHAGVQAMDMVVGLVSGFMGLPMVQASFNASSAPSPSAIRTASGALATINFVMMLLNAPPELQTLTARAKQGTGIADFALNGVRKARDTANRVGAVAGWASYTASLVGILGGIGNLGIEIAARHSVKHPASNPLVVKAQATVAKAVIKLSTASVSLMSGAAMLLSGGPAGWSTFAVAVALWEITSAIVALTASEGSMVFAEGDEHFDVRPKRGRLWRSSGPTLHESTTDRLLGWMDVDADGVQDLVVASHDAGSSSLAVAIGDSDRGDVDRKTRAWKRWKFADTAVPETLNSSQTDWHFNATSSDRDVHFATQATQRTGFMDMNGDGLPDLVDVGPLSLSGHGITVYPNTGTGFDKRELWAGDLASAPSLCKSKPALSRSRSLSWTEYDKSRNGLDVMLNNTTELWLDINRDGLPDRVIKDESGYNNYVSGGDCTLSRHSSVCESPQPTDPEPEKNLSKKCSGWDSASVWYAHADGWKVDDGTGEGWSHLSKAAQEVHSPRTMGYHYVAFNNGVGFDPYVRLNTKMPSLGGGVSFAHTSKKSTFPPDWGVSGATNFIADPDGKGVHSAISLDIDNANIKKLSGSGAHPIHMRFKLGIAHPDTLERIGFPDGGTIEATYGVVREVQGDQGPPVLVLKRTEWDDGVREDFNTDVAGVPGTLPFVEYSYHDAKLQGRDFLGFAAVAEHRFDGVMEQQVLQTFSQDLTTLGVPLCTESRGRLVNSGDVLAVEGAAEHPTCGDGRSFGEPSDPGPSCYFSAPSMFPRGLLSLKKRTENAYDSAGSIAENLPNGDVWPAWPSIDVHTKRQTRFAGPQTSWIDIEFLYNPSPFKTPHIKRVTTSSGGARETESTWVHHASDWVFLRTQEDWFHGTGSGRTSQRTESFVFGTTAPFDLQRHVVSDGSDTRSRIFTPWPNGAPKTLEVNGVVTSYTYFDNTEHGTGLVKTMSLSTDSFRPVGGSKTFTYNAMGQVLTQSDELGNTTVLSYDGLGILERETTPDTAPMDRTHADAGAPLFLRTGLSTASRTTDLQVTEGQTIRATTWWDGFGRAFRRGTGVDGLRTLQLDYDGDGLVDENRMASDDRDWFLDRSADYLLRDLRLTASGKIQCESLPYVDLTTGPQAYGTTLRGVLGHERFREDFEGFGAETTYGVTPSKGLEIRRTDDLGHYRLEEQDAFGHPRTLDESGLIDTEVATDDWGNVLRTTDGRGFVSIREINAFGETLKKCQQLVPGGVPSTNVCPSAWPTTHTEYDAAGRIVRLVDPEGNETLFEASNCGGAGKTTYPSTSTSDPSLASSQVASFDAACRRVSRLERNGADTTWTHDGAGRITSRTSSRLGDSVTVAWGHDALGRRLWASDGEGYRTYKIRDFRDNLLHTINALGAQASKEFDVLNHQVRSVDGLGHEVSASYDTMGRVVSRSWNATTCNDLSLWSGTFATAPVMVAESFDYDDKGRLLAHHQVDGGKESYTYDDLNRVIVRCPPDPNNVGLADCTAPFTFQYDAAGNKRREVEPGGLVRELTLDGLRRVTVEKLSHPSSFHTMETSREYDKADRLIQESLPGVSSVQATTCTLPGAQLVNHTYNAHGQRESTTHAADAGGIRHTEYFEYDQAGQLVVQTSILGHDTFIDYDFRGRAVRTEDPEGSVNTVKYDLRGLVSEKTDARGLTTAISHDAAGRVSEIQAPGPSAGPVRTCYDAAGNVLAKATEVDLSAGRWEVMRHEYTPGGKLEATHRASYIGADPCTGSLTDLTTELTCYDNSGLQWGHRDGEGNISRTQHDLRGRKTTAVHPPVYGMSSWSASTFHYDVDDKLVKVVTPFGFGGPVSVTTNYTLDVFHRVKGEAFSQSIEDKKYVYGASGQVCAVHNVSGGGTPTRTTLMTYNAGGLLVERASTPGVVETFQHDDAGNIVSAADETGSWTWTFDHVNRPLTQVQYVDALATAFTTTFAWDANGRLEQLGYPSVAGATYGPTTLDITRSSTSAVIDSVHKDGVDLVVEFLDRDGAGRMLSRVMGNGTQLLETFDDKGFRREVRLMTSGAPYHVRHYHDGVGNLTYLDDQIDDVFDFEFNYDSRNRLESTFSTALGGWRWYRLNDAGLPVEFTGSALPVTTYNYAITGNLMNVVGGTGASYVHDGYGNRVSDGRTGFTFTFDAQDRLKTATPPSGPTEQSGYAFDGRRVTHGDKVFVYGLDRLPLAEVTASGAGVSTDVRFNVPLGDQLTHWVDGLSGAERYAQSNHQGSPAVVTDAIGTPVADLAWDPWGLPITRGGGSMGTDLGFQANYTNASSGTVVMGARHYDPHTAAFLSPDPIGLHGGLGRHTFVSGNPLAATDRTGLSEVIEVYGVLEPYGSGSNPFVTPVAVVPDVFIRSQAEMDDFVTLVSCAKYGVGCENSNEIAKRLIAEGQRESGVNPKTGISKVGLIRYVQALIQRNQGDYLSSMSNAATAVLDQVGATMFLKETPYETYMKIGELLLEELLTLGLSTQLRGADALAGTVQHAPEVGRVIVRSTEGAADLRRSMTTAETVADTNKTLDTQASLASPPPPPQGASNVATDAAESLPAGPKQSARPTSPDLPAKSTSPSVPGNAEATVQWASKQLQKKWKHAGDFGLSGNFSKANAAKFREAMHKHIDSPGVRRISGTYHKAPVTHHLDPTTGLNVMSDAAGNFISGWKLSSSQLQNVLTHGGL